MLANLADLETRLEFADDRLPALAGRGTAGEPWETRRELCGMAE